MPRIGYTSSDEYELEQALIDVLRAVGEIGDNEINVIDRCHLLTIAREYASENGISPYGPREEDIPF